ncbi:hypothetical protein ACMFMG_003137 [Clarireedia jacksonii]
MSATETITLDPDGDLVLMLDQITGTRSDSQASSTTSECATTPTSNTSKKKSNPVYKVRMVVSSKHMCLASPVFKAMLKGGFQEAEKLREKGKIEIPLPDDDAAAFKVLARLIHGRFSAIPSSVSLLLFTHIAILVDKYQMHEILQLSASSWSILLKWGGGFCTSWPDRFRWLCITYVLRMAPEFKDITQTICRECDRNIAKLIEECDLTFLPIPQSVLNAIDSASQQLTKKAISPLYIQIAKHQGAQTWCPLSQIPTISSPYDRVLNPVYGELTTHKIHCDALVLGFLIKSASAQGLYPEPVLPCASYSLLSIYERVNKLEVTTACEKLSGRKEDNHGILDGLRAEVKAVWDSAVGLDLTNPMKWN